MITTSEVEKIAKLAKLTFSSEEITGFAKELSSIMRMIDKLNELDCQNVSPLTSLADTEQSLRSDFVTENDISEELFTNAPGKTADFAKGIKCFVVPKMIE